MFLDILVCFFHALPPLYGLCEEASTLGEFNHGVADYIDIAEFAISIWMRHGEHLDVLSVAEHHLYRLVAIHWVVEAGESLLGLL